MTNPENTLALTDAILFTGETFVENQALLIRGSAILDIVPMAHVPADVQRVSCAHHILAPAFIDCQVNGGGNVLLNQSPTVEGVLTIANAHRKTGTTRLLPTCITDTPDVMRAALSATREARKSDPSIIGVHFEGPHINPEMKGAHNESLIRPMTDEDMSLYRAQTDERFVITISPDQVSTRQIAQLVTQGLIVSMGHSNVTDVLAQASIKAGATGFTHILTRMPPIKTREPGLAVFALNNNDTYAGIISDGIHISPELVRLAVRAKDEDRLYMVSDSAPPAGADMPLPYVMGGATVTPVDGKCLNEHGVIAGAHYTLGECVSIAIRDIRLDPQRVLRMASTIPARFLGLGDRLGCLLPGYSADIVALDHMFRAQKVWRDGVAV